MKTMYRVVGGPNCRGSKVISVETGEELKGVQAITLRASAKEGADQIWVAVIELVGVEVDVTTIEDTSRRYAATA